MGDRNGVAIAQAVHEELLRKHGCLKDHNTMSYNSHTPNSKLWEGIYLDDHTVAQILPKTCLQCVSQIDRCAQCHAADHVYDDVTCLARSLDAYASEKLPLSIDKCFRYQEQFESWGTEIDGKTGHVGVNLEKRHQSCRLGLCISKQTCVSKDLLQAFAGCLVHPFMHCRPLMSLFHRYHKFMSNIPEKGSVPLPPDIRDEIIGMCLFISLAHSNIRTPASRVISATDSTPGQAGGCSATVPSKLSRALFRRTEEKGTVGRLDSDLWGEMLEQENCPMRPPDYDSNRLIEALPWTSPWSQKHTELHHINLQEALAVRFEMDRRVRAGQSNVRAVFANDSRVCVGAFSKGRSSSFQLNGLLRKCIFHRVLYGFHVGLIWVGTKFNPADYPSRNAQLPVRPPLPVWAAQAWDDGLPSSSPRSSIIASPSQTQHWTAAEYY